VPLFVLQRGAHAGDRLGRGLHSRKNLEFLIESAGPKRVLLGSDYPYDMGTGECVRQVRALSIPEADKATVLGTQAWSLVGGA
jgi:aminocarboxymuconate-semialdehyde decarboxylase